MGGVAMSRKTKLGHRLNWRRDIPDRRDLLLPNQFSEQPLPGSVDLRSMCPPVVDQGQVGSCTANALAGALGFLEVRDIALKSIGTPEEFNPVAFSAFSRMFIYWNERAIEGDTDQDGGAQIRDGVKSLASTGCCSEATWPYLGEGNEFTRPSAACYSEAQNHKITSYLSLDNSDAVNLKGCLAAGFPFVFGFTVYDSFESQVVAASGVMPMPGPNELALGGHAVLAVGYDDEKSSFIVRNSWGTGWGDKGYFYMPYEYAVDPDLADDFWTVRR